MPNYPRINKLIRVFELIIVIYIFELGYICQNEQEIRL